MQTVKLVPVVALITEDSLSSLMSLVELSEIQSNLEPFEDLMVKNNWTPEMLVGGILLQESLSTKVTDTPSWAKS